MKRISLNIFIVFIVLLQSCIKEDLSKCESVLLLRFRYTLNNQETNLFDSKIHQVNVYIFDSDGKFVDNFTEQGDKLTNDYVMRIPLPKGEYQIVAYGGDFSTYSTGEIDNQTNILNNSLRKGVTDIADFRAELKSVIGDGGYLYPAAVPNDLYAGFAHNVASTENNQNVKDIELISNSKKIKVKITGTNFVTMPLEVHITTTNGRYGYDNNIDESHGIFKYLPINSLEQPNYIEIDLKTLRLMMGSSAILLIKSDSDVLYEENIIEQILLSPEYNTQEDLDREDEFVFELNITPSSNGIVITVTVNGWVINNIVPDN